LTIGPAPRTVVIVDDHAAVRDVARVVAEATGLVVVAEAADGAAAIAAVATTAPDVVLLDIGLPGLDGITIAERLATLDRPPCVVLMSARDPESYGERLERAPVRGFIPKQRLSTRTLAAILP
jgi:DNA-binding NarL/FixJ family response regulator